MSLISFIPSCGIVAKLNVDKRLSVVPIILAKLFVDNRRSVVPIFTTDNLRVKDVPESLRASDIALLRLESLFVCRKEQITKKCAYKAID